jgi:hypothetical protein
MLLSGGIDPSNNQKNNSTFLYKFDGQGAIQYEG